MTVRRISENTEEVKLRRTALKKVRLRSGVPPTAAERNVYNPLHSPQSYDNYGNHTPYGAKSTLSSDGSSGAGDSGASSSASA